MDSKALRNYFILSTHLLFLSLLQHSFMAEAATCDDCYTQSRAAYYSSQDDLGTEVGACGFGSFGVSLNGGDVSAASQLYRNGVGCGSCYQVRCTNNKNCSEQGVTIVITDHGEGDRTDFILSRRAFGKMARTQDASSSLLALGVLDIEYKRVSCNYPNKNITFKVDEASNYPHYLAFLIWYQQGKKDIIAVQLCETKNLECKLVDRSHGAVWAVNEPPSGPLSIRLLVSGGEDGDETWVVPTNTLPQDWKAGEVYDSGLQMDL
ncbi:hypothetical protein AMTRI_Chr03g145790 [Amborella trichopoda]